MLSLKSELNNPPQKKGELAIVMDYTLIRSQRKSCAIYVRDGAVELRAPLWLPKEEIDRFVKSKENWIKSKLTEQGLRLEKQASFLLDYGDTVLYRGKEVPIVAKNGGYAGYCDEGFFMPSDLPPEEIKRVCIKIYRLCAKNLLTERSALFAEKMGVTPAAIKINGAKTRWGSCSAQRNINFSWRLIMAEDHVIDYVVTHELAHLKEMNHSSRFWLLVEKTLPDYRQALDALKKLQDRLKYENWDI